MAWQKGQKSAVRQSPHIMAIFSTKTWYSNVIAMLICPHVWSLRVLWNGVSEMRQPSIVIHKGRKEEKYEIYVEDYVLSFLKERKDMSNAEEVLFYGCREKGGRQYTIYGAGLDRHLAVFDKYDLLEEIGCRLTQTDPVFLVREKKGVYEIKGYKVFYYENEEMQNYLIHQDRKESGKTLFDGGHSTIRKEMSRRPAKRHAGQNPQYLISLQLGLVFVVLVAIVINSANSYDKMEQLNQSAEEVFFVMENQETDKLPVTEKEEVRNDIVIEREPAEHNAPQDNVLQDNVLQENTMQEQRDREEETAESQPETGSVEASAESQPETDGLGDASETSPETGNPSEEDGEDTSADAQEETGTDTLQEKEETEKNEGQENGDEEDGVEALSRNVARYYEVERGDTLYMISKKVYGDTSHVKRICEINQITDPDNICYGQKIILP